jgi:hypothetical protein
VVEAVAAVPLAVELLVLQRQVVVLVLLPE